jgi:hypothetical protein
MVYTTTQYLDFVKILFTFKMSQYASKCNFRYTHKKGTAFPGPQMFKIIVYTKLHPNQMINVENMHKNSFMSRSKVWLSLTQISGNL